MNSTEPIMVTTNVRLAMVSGLCSVAMARLRGSHLSGEWGVAGLAVGGGSACYLDRSVWM